MAETTKIEGSNDHATESEIASLDRGLDPGAPASSRSSAAIRAAFGVPDPPESESLAPQGTGREASNHSASLESGWSGTGLDNSTLMNSDARLTQVPITLHALLLRLKRYHGARGESVHVTRARLESRLGRWHLIGTRNVIQSWWRTLDELVQHARAEGVLAPHETVEVDPPSPTPTPDIATATT